MQFRDMANIIKAAKITVIVLEGFAYLFLVFKIPLGIAHKNSIVSIAVL